MFEDEDIKGWGIQVYFGVNVYNYQYFFCFCIDVNIDGFNNIVFVNDVVFSEVFVGSFENFYGNGFYNKCVKFVIEGEVMMDYNGVIFCVWEIVNINKFNFYSKKFVSYKLVSREVFGFIFKEGFLVWKCVVFVRYVVYVIKYCDDEFWFVGKYVFQIFGELFCGIIEWIGDGIIFIDNIDIVFWYIFGVIYFLFFEDFFVMFVELMMFFFCF